MSNWYYYRNGQQIGPIALNELTETITRGYVEGDTLVWQLGMSEWIKVRRHPDLVSSILTPPPLPASAKNATRPLKRVAASILDAVRGMRIH